MKYSLRSLMTFSIRDLFWVTAVVALVLGWYADRDALATKLWSMQEDERIRLYLEWKVRVEREVSEAGSNTNLAAAEQSLTELAEAIKRSSQLDSIAKTDLVGPVMDAIRDVRLTPQENPPKSQAPAPNPPGSFSAPSSPK